MGFNGDCNVFGNSYSIDASESATVKTANAVALTMSQHGNFAPSVDNLHANRLDHPSRTEYIWQDHERLQLQQQVNTWNMMRYRMRKMEQQQQLLQQYRNDWSIVNQMPQEVKHAAPNDNFYHICPYLHDQCLEYKSSPVLSNTCSSSDAYVTQTPQMVDSHHTCATTLKSSKSSNIKQQKRTRISFTKQQFLVLEHAYQYNRYLNKLTLEHLSNELGITEKQVKTWFQNRRAKNNDCGNCLIQRRLSRRRRVPTL